jgi:predicted small metal-binding protein
MTCAEAEEELLRKLKEHEQELPDVTEFSEDFYEIILEAIRDGCCELEEPRSRILGFHNYGFGFRRPASAINKGPIIITIGKLGKTMIATRNPVKSRLCRGVRLN